MILTRKQEEGLKLIVERYRAGARYTTISGYAGTGKSTLVKFAIEALDVEESKVAYATFTGKAAEVLRKKGNKGATTLHKLLYDNIPRPGGGYYHRPKQYLEQTIIVVDEVSIVPKTMINLLLGHRVYVIFLGDPFQLPSLNKEDAHDLLDHPHIFLDEVMRQAAESEIIQMTMKIRNREEIPFIKGKEVNVIPLKEMVDGCYKWADQILTATNVRRKQVNRFVRQMQGYSGLPREGERMICLHNYWEDIATNGDALVNGTTGTIHSISPTSVTIPPFVQTDNHFLRAVNCTFKADEDTFFYDVNMDRELIENGRKCVDWRTEYKLMKAKSQIGDIVPREFDYGYAITCHKSQGSQWKNVLVLEENFPFDKEEHARWLYTACTRPEERLLLVREC